ncbi:uncharacterized protein NECHADRAFT_86834 [Fusarium vanettenii 77-13-4]|uniref:Uncharacterized protein n=1 Tax=Fusarium vanettenii (strain ATCC MYA-4622 / CBS 123669 / FGSC 9596 / NRRL 45880 / 77-13-4) TaxID=660122 RepID=C7ZK74_FUSV7|nr:uncharacterized protein NECHADRAFT_86834 [Fusarium vanettenii 77-13-4]EEU35626.1 predicted protein [Fusarium vanettenii 77-13-4]
MSFTIWLLVSHKGASIPGQWSFFMAPERTEPGMLISNLISIKGYSLNSVSKPVTFSTISLGIFLDQIANHEEKIRQIAAAVTIPERPAGTVVGIPACEAWAFAFAQRLIDEQYLDVFSMSKLRAARSLRIEGMPINM